MFGRQPLGTSPICALRGSGALTPIRLRFRDLSGPTVLVDDQSEPAIATIDTSEGAP